MRIRELPVFNLFYRNKEVIRLAIPVFIELILGVGINYINQFMFAGVPEATAREAMRVAANKLPVKTKFVVRESEIGGDNDEDK